MTLHFCGTCLRLPQAGDPESPVLSAAQIMCQSDLSHYVAGWIRSGDVGFIAEDRIPLGAAWWRFFTKDDPGYGFVGAAIPEIAIGVIESRRGTGIGTELLRRLITEAESLSLPALSLSVDPDNYAVATYEKLGFVTVDIVGGSLTMLLSLSMS